MLFNVVTVIGSYVVPKGTVTVSEVAEADETFAFIAPKKTTLLARLGLKFEPVMVTTAPIGPDWGEKELIIGCPYDMEYKIHPVTKRRSFFIREHWQLSLH